MRERDAGLEAVDQDIANAFSLAQAYCIPEAWPRAIYAGNTPVGFRYTGEEKHGELRMELAL